MLKFIYSSFLLLFSLHSFAALPTWITILNAPADFDPALCESSLPVTAFDLVGKYFSPTTPGMDDVLIGQKVTLTLSSPQLEISFKYQDIKTQISLQTTAAYFTTNDNQLLDMHKYIGYDPAGAFGGKLIYNWGYVEGAGDDYKPIEGVITCQVPNSSDSYNIRVSGGVTIFTNNFLHKFKQLKVVSKSQQPLVRGEVKLTRLAGSSLEEREDVVEIKNGKVNTDVTDLELSAGHYRVELVAPSECAGEIIDQNFILTPEMLDNDEALKFEIVCSYAYDMTLSGYVDDDVQYGAKLVYSFTAKDIITHDATEDSEDDYNLAHFNGQYDEQGYPLDISGQRLTLPMKDKNRDPRVIMSSWTDQIELEYAHFENHGDGSVDECELEKSADNEFGFMRINETIRHPLTQDESPAGSYPYLNVELICHHIEAHGHYDYVASIKISPLVPTIIGGNRIFINAPLSGEAQEELLKSGEAFTQIYAKNNKSHKRGGMISPYEASMKFKGHFTKKEMKKRSGRSDDDDGGDPGDIDLPDNVFIFTDPTSIEHIGKQVMLSIVVLERDQRVSNISYEVHCLNNTDEIVLQGHFTSFTPYNPPFAYAEKVYTFPRRKKCNQVKVIFDHEHQFMDENFFQPPGREVILDWPID